MSNTQQAYTRYQELQKAVDNCLADRDSLHALRTSINATIEQLEAQIPKGEVYTREQVMLLFCIAENELNIEMHFGHEDAAMAAMNILKKHVK